MAGRAIGAMSVTLKKPALQIGLEAFLSDCQRRYC